MKARKPYALIAEADPQRAATYAELVHQIGLEPNHVRDGQSGKIALRTRGVPALVICEMALPRVDGFALLEDLRQRTPPEDTPVVVVSAFLELRSRAWEQRDALGISEVLATTATAEAVQLAIKRALNRTQQVERRAPEPGPARLDASTLAALPTSAFADCRDDSAQLLAGALAELFRVPLAVVQVHDRVYLGGQAQLLPAQVDALCEVLDSQRDSTELVADAIVDARRMRLPFIRTGSWRSIALAAVVSAAGRPLGRLALLHPTRMAIDAHQLEALTTVAMRLAGEVELQRHDPSVEIVLPPSPDEAALYRPIFTALQEVETGIVLFDGARTVSFANRTAVAMLGLVEDLRGMPLAEFFERAAAAFEDPAEFRRRLHIPQSGPFALRAQLEQQRPVRRVLRWVVRPVVESANASGAILTLTDVTADVDLASAREALTGLDPLSGLPNRGAAEEALFREIARGRREQLPVAVAIADLDRFGQFNDKHGTSAGDEVLKRVSLALDATIRGGDLVARWGADEFLIVLPGVNQGGALAAAERFRLEIEGLRFGERGGVTASFGVSEVDLAQPPEIALRRARQRVDQARKSGGNCAR